MMSWTALFDALATDGFPPSMGAARIAAAKRLINQVSLPSADNLLQRPQLVFKPH